jgi:hypothetical protein
MLLSWDRETESSFPCSNETKQLYFLSFPVT